MHYKFEGNVIMINNKSEMMDSFSLVVVMIARYACNPSLQQQNGNTINRLLNIETEILTCVDDKDLYEEKTIKCTHIHK